MSYIPKYFNSSEVFHPRFLEEHYDGKNIFSIVDDIIWMKLDKVREGWDKPIYINVGEIKNCGVRPIDSKVGAAKSAHKPIYADRQAFDLHGSNSFETHALYEWCAIHWREYHICRIEDFVYTPGWVHIEICINDPSECHIFKP